MDRKAAIEAHIKDKFHTRYNRPNRPEHKIEHRRESLVERDGYIPISQQIAIARRSGEILVDWRQSAFPAQTFDDTASPVFSDKIEGAEIIKQTTERNKEALKKKREDLRKQQWEKIKEQVRAEDLAESQRQALENPPTPQGGEETPE